MRLVIEFAKPNNLLDNTRRDYNKLVYEIRDLSSNPTFYEEIQITLFIFKNMKILMNTLNNIKTILKCYLFK